MKLGVGIHEYEIVKTRWGLCHAFKQGDGTYVHCRRNPATCIACANDGVPPVEPDPFDVKVKALVANWNKRWAESNRHPATLADNQIWEGRGLHIVALADDDPSDRTMLISFGDDDTAMSSISALVAAHNKMIGKAD
ncbi:hypothetical protein NUH86_10790 [Sphingobium sp. JS3065]|uniref:hypothetical protein n=1 Tax=Sphingobium sp. JS3065 TaxID=2970925 RepID=UPI002264AA70|nr:hypothetical protein [Sphingobium sp. JS3065]UZW54021.1 hypothetical protein NUH86_10790 [Sphingobium sp. JS3065]